MHLDHPYPRRFAGRLALSEPGCDRRAGAAGARADRSATADDRRPGTGDQMLVRIAATLIGGDAAWLYVMDEPTAALTNAGRAPVRRDLRASAAGRRGALRLAPDGRGDPAQPSGHRAARWWWSSGPLSGTDQTRIIEEMTGRDLAGCFRRGSPREPAMWCCAPQDFPPGRCTMPILRCVRARYWASPGCRGRAAARFFLRADRGAAVVEEQHTDFAAIARIDQARSVDQRDPVAQRQAGSGQDQTGMPSGISTARPVDICHLSPGPIPSSLGGVEVQSGVARVGT